MMLTGGGLGSVAVTCLTGGAADYVVKHASVRRSSPWARARGARRPSPLRRLRRRRRARGAVPSLDAARARVSGRTASSPEPGNARVPVSSNARAARATVLIEGKRDGKGALRPGAPYPRPARARSFSPRTRRGSRGTARSELSRPCPWRLTGADRAHPGLFAQPGRRHPVPRRGGRGERDDPGEVAPGFLQEREVARSARPPRARKSTSAPWAATNRDLRRETGRHFRLESCSPPARLPIVGSRCAAREARGAARAAFLDRLPATRKKPSPASHPERSRDGALRPWPGRARASRTRLIALVLCAEPGDADRTDATRARGPSATWPLPRYRKSRSVELMRR